MCSRYLPVFVLSKKYLKASISSLDLSTAGEPTAKATKDKTATNRNIFINYLSTTSLATIYIPPII